MTDDQKEMKSDLVDALHQAGDLLPMLEDLPSSVGVAGLEDLLNEQIQKLNTAIDAFGDE